MTRTGIFLIGAVAMSLLLLGCPPDPEPPAPRRPQFVPKSSDTAKVERGIRPVPGQNAIRLEWFRNTERDLAGYRVFRTSEVAQDTTLPINFRLLREIPLGSQEAIGLPDTVFIDAAAVPDVQYYYQIEAYTRRGARSERSVPESFRLATRVEPRTPIGQLVFSRSDTTIYFEWGKPSFASGFYVLKLYEFRGFDTFFEEDCVAILYDGSSFRDRDTVSINFGQVFQAPSPVRRIPNGLRVFKRLESGVQYRWQVQAFPEDIDRRYGTASELLGFRVSIN
ncbi:MAG: hypothetical protein CMR00_08615 [[Chlorobium] sp. 445]|nr:MAG: hypothetical protein CMR00_08615 [[Chlorobium] sp. 445]